MNDDAKSKNEQNLKQTDSAPAGASTVSTSAPDAPNFGSLSSKPKRKGPSKNTMLTGAVVLVLVVGIIVGLVFAAKQKKQEETEDYYGSIENNIEQAEVVSVDVPYDDRDSYVAYYESIISGETVATEDVLTAKLELANYYVSISDLVNALPILEGLDQSSFTNYDYFRYYNVMARYYSVAGEYEKRDEANALSADYRNRYQVEMNTAQTLLETGEDAEAAEESSLETTE